MYYLPAIKMGVPRKDLFSLISYGALTIVFLEVKFKPPKE